MNNFKLSRHLKGDKQIWWILLFLSLISIVVVYSSVSALAYRKSNGNTEIILFRHTLLIGLGLFITFIIHKIDFLKYTGIIKLLLFLTPFLILYTLIFGISVGGARRWVSVMGFSLQTSDIVRLILITNLSAMLARRLNKKYEHSDLVIMIGWIGVIVGMLSLSSFSTSVILGLTCFLIMWIGQVPKKYLVYLSAVLIALISLVMIVGLSFKRFTGNELGRVQTVIDRTESFLNVDLDGDKAVGGETGSTSDQKNFALIAIAHGGIFGVGPGNSTQKNVLPDAFSDFIYAILIEEYGLIGGLIVIGLYLWLLYRGIYNVENTTRGFGGILSVGLTLSIVLQAFAHMFINVGLGPVTGQTLPLISMGGTSAWFTFTALGIVLSVTQNKSIE